MKKLVILLFLIWLVGCDPIPDYNTPLTTTKWLVETEWGYCFIQFINDNQGIYIYNQDIGIPQTKRYVFDYWVKGDQVTIFQSRNGLFNMTGYFDEYYLYIDNLKLSKL